MGYDLAKHVEDEESGQLHILNTLAQCFSYWGYSRSLWGSTTLYLLAYLCKSFWAYSFSVLQSARPWPTQSPLCYKRFVSFWSFSVPVKENRFGIPTLISKRKALPTTHVPRFQSIHVYFICDAKQNLGALATVLVRYKKPVVCLNTRLYCRKSGLSM